MGQLDIAKRRQRGFAPLQGVGHASDQQAVFNGVKPLRTLRMAGAHFVLMTIRMGEITGRVHG